MARNPRREANLARIAGRQRAAGKKVSRIKGQGVNASAVDPRKPWAEVQSMTGRQLRSYEASLNRFTSRATQYVAGKGGAPIPRSTWNRLTAVQAQVNAKVREFEASIANVPVVGRTTVAQRRAMLSDSLFPKPGGGWRPMQARERNPSGFPGESEVRQVIADLKAQLRPGFLRKEATAQRAVVEKMLRDTGDRETAEVVEHLTDHQLYLLVHETDFMAGLGFRYDNRELDTEGDDVYDQWGSNVQQRARDALNYPKR